jgi:hypothetical protein
MRTQRNDLGVLEAGSGAGVFAVRMCISCVSSNASRSYGVDDRKLRWKKRLAMAWDFCGDNAMISGPR